MDERHELIWATVTLNGEPARIMGARNDFATVVQTRTGLRAEWAWETVRRIVERGGDFRS